MASVLLADSDFSDLDLERSLLADAGFELVGPRGVSEAGEDVSGLLVMWTEVGHDVMEAIGGLRAIGRFGVGVDSIDVGAATRRGIPVVHSGGYATEEVSLHAVAMILSLLRRLPQGDLETRAGRWIEAGHFRGLRRASELRAGVVGLGSIGARVAAHLRALGLQVAGFDPAGRPPGVERFERLEDLLRVSDVVSLHVPLTADTHGILDSDALASLPAGAIVVNTARGGLIDEEALVAALDSGHVSGAGLDVFEDEPLGPGSPLLERRDVLLSPHVGYFSEQALVEARTRTVQNLISVLRGERPEDVANPEALRMSG